MRAFRLTRDDSADIGFATTCLTTSAVTFEEFKEWLYRVIEVSDDCPSWVFDILDLKAKFDHTLRVRQIIGFIPGAGLSDDERCAVDGIAYTRFPDHRSDLTTKDTALAALRRHPHIEADFRALFPEIIW